MATELLEKQDYVIVGSGVAGITLAKLLLEDDADLAITILEAGPRIPQKDRRHWWDLAIKSVYDDPGRKPVQKYLPYEWTYDQPGDVEVNRIPSGNGGSREAWYVGDQRMMARGGSTMHWGGWSLRFKPEDFVMRDATETGVNWPFGYDHLEPYYCKAEQLLAVCGDNEENWGSPDHPMHRSQPYPLPPYEWSAPEKAMAAAWEHNGIVPGRMPLARFRKCMTTGTCKYCPFGARFSAEQLLDELEQCGKYPNLTVKCNAPATKIICKSRAVAEGVQYIDTSTGESETLYGDRIVLCSGTLETPKLLKLSSDDRHWPNGIGNDDDLVGRFLVSHSQLVVRGRRRSNSDRWFQEYDFPTLMSRTYDSQKYQREGKLFLYNNRKYPNFDIANAMIAGMTRSQVIAEMEKERVIGLEGFFEDKGRHENFVDLHGSRKTSLGLPRTKIHFKRRPEAQAAAESWLGKMETIVRSMGYDEIPRRRVNDPGGHHATGTCRMSHARNEGVVAPDHRVHEMDNLYICSNAVFPTVSAVNPTLTLTAMVFRLAEILTNQFEGEAS